MRCGVCCTVEVSLCATRIGFEAGGTCEIDEDDEEEEPFAGVRLAPPMVEDEAEDFLASAGLSPLLAVLVLVLVVAGAVL